MCKGVPNLSNKNINKPKAPKNTKGNVNFFGALLVGFGCCAAVWILLALVFALVLSSQENPVGLVPFLSPVTVVVSLAVGGFAAAKLDRKNAYLSAVVIGCAFLGVSYAVTSVFEIARGYGAAVKSLIIAMMLISPLLGAKIAVGRGEKKRRHRKM